MHIYYEKSTGTFHLQNHFYSYIMKILPNGHVGHLYFGPKVRHRTSFDHLLELACRTMSPCVFEGDMMFSLEQVRQEFPSAGTGDFRQPAVSVLQSNGSTLCDFVFESFRITDGKPALKGLPSTYCESEEEAQTLHIFISDPLTGVRAELLYTVFEAYPALARSVRFENLGREDVFLDTAMSLNLDLPDAKYDLIQLSGAWCRERFVHRSPLRPGIQSIQSLRGHSSHNHNPFLALAQPGADERQGEVFGISLIYSGNFLAQAEVDSWGVTRVSIGIHPQSFRWKLVPGASFQTPEAVLVLSEEGFGGMSRAFHKLFQRRLSRGYWRDRPRPILINNWEATAWDFTQAQILKIARTAKDLGIELFVLDDGWSKNRKDDSTGLGDWTSDPEKLPDGIKGLSEKIRETGLSFGLWFEPEMLNRDSDLFREHPGWVVKTPGRIMSHGRNEYVLDYSRHEVVDYIFERMAAVLKEGKVSYVKWDMNRSITEGYSSSLPADRQGEFAHRYILGVYELYDRLNAAFPQILFESCASGGGRFDPGLLYYAPQGWASDCSDAAQRIKIQYGTSFCYPVSSIGAHVSKSPNMQLGRCTPLHTRANVACFGAFGYELDPGGLSLKEREIVKRQISFVKENRALLQYGTFYRLLSPFENNYAAWMVVSDDRRNAIVGWYKFLNEVNGPFRRVRLMGLDEAFDYKIQLACHGDPAKVPGHEDIAEGTGPDLKGGAACPDLVCGGDELMRIGLITTDSSAGEPRPPFGPSCDFDSRLYLLRAVPSAALQ